MPHTVETTIALDAEVLESAREYAQTGGVSLDQIITDALRQALESPTVEEPRYRNGIRLLRGGKCGPVVTTEGVNALMDTPD